MGGMTILTDTMRYVVTVEVSGPKDGNVAKAVNDVIDKLKADPTIQAVVKVSINGQKPKPGQNQ
jgi:hypothetical protein